jgi:hypothetical protein
MTFRSTIAAAILLAGTAFAAAQTVVVTPEQELVVGAIIPDILKPGELSENTLPTKYQYVVMDGRTVLIEPQTRRVVHIID